MGDYLMAEVDRAMKVQEVILRAIGGQLQWYEAAEILGVSCRTMRRWKSRYEMHGYDGLYDRRRQRPSPRRVPIAQVQEVLRLYQEQYRGYNVAHFHDMLVAEHEIELSYEWVKKALQGAGLVHKGQQHKRHRKRRERRPMKGMMVFCDGSTHEWLSLRPGEHQDLIVYLDDATSEVYAAYLVPEEGTGSCLQGLRQVVETHGLFCALYTDRGSHFFYTLKAGGPVDRSRLTQYGRALSQLGIEHIPSYSPEGRGRMERLFGTWQGRLPQELRTAGITTMEAANEYINRRFIPWHNRALTIAPREDGTAFVPATNADLDAIISIHHERIVQNDNTVSVGKLKLQIEAVAWHVSFAKCQVKVCEHLDGRWSVRYGPRILGWYQMDGTPLKKAQKKRWAA